MDGVEKLWAFSLLPMALVAVWWLWWKRAQARVAKLRHSIRYPKDRVDVEDTLRKTDRSGTRRYCCLGRRRLCLGAILDQRDTAQKQIAVFQIRLSTPTAGSGIP